MKTTFKKSISLMLTVLMVLSCWVFFPGMIPEVKAASIVTYPITINAYLSGCGGGGNIKVYYYPVNSDGSLDKTDNSKYYLFMNSLTQYSSNSSLQTLTAADSGDTRSTTDSSKHTGNIPGWPYKVEITTTKKTSGFTTTKGNIAVQSIIEIGRAHV